MKAFYLICVLCVCVLAGCGRRNATPEEAAAYNDALVSHGDTVLQAFDAFNVAVDGRDSVSARKRLGLAVTAAERAVAAVGRMRPFEGDSSLRDATLGVMRYYERSFRDGFGPMLPLLLADTLSEGDARRADSLIHDFSFEEDSLRMIMLEAQGRFSNRYGLRIY